MGKPRAESRNIMPKLGCWRGAEQGPHLDLQSPSSIPLSRDMWTISPWEVRETEEANSTTPRRGGLPWLVSMPGYACLQHSSPESGFPSHPEGVGQTPAMAPAQTQGLPGVCCSAALLQPPGRTTPGSLGLPSTDPLRAPAPQMVAAFKKG